MPRLVPRALGCLAALACLAGCGRRNEPAADRRPARVLAVSLSRHAAPPGSLPRNEGIFDRPDTVFASIRTVGREGTLTVVWTRVGAQQLDASSAVSRAAGGVSVFHLAPEHGWAPGKYQVEVMLNGASEQSRDFEVP